MLISNYLRAIEALPAAGLERLGNGGVTVLAPHPDDEVLGAGGLIAASREAGRSVNVVVLTDGTGSHPNSKRYPSHLLAELRRQECRKGLAVLGLPESDIIHFDQPDTRAPISGPVFEAAAGRLSGLVRQNESTSLLVTWDKDPHCDHFAAARLAREVGRRVPGLAIWHYPVWGWILPRMKHIHRRGPEGFSLDISQWIDRKRAAIACHLSQMSGLIDDDPSGFTFPSDKLARFLRPTEYFIQRLR